MSGQPNDVLVYKRHSLLKRNPARSRRAFSEHYELHHGPLAANQAGFRKFTTKYIQNHVQDLPDGAEPPFDGVSMTTQVPRPDYSKGFFNEPDYENVKPDEIYLFDLTKTVSLLGVENPIIDGQATPHKALLLTTRAAIAEDRFPGVARLVLNSLDTTTASALGFHEGSFPHDLLAEIWFQSDDDRSAAVSAVAGERDRQRARILLPVREVLFFSPEMPWPNV